MSARPAPAHLDSDPEAITPGATATVPFTVEHGCDTSPTIKMKFKIPKGITDVEAEPKDGWTSRVTRRLVVFSGGPLDAETTDTFSITFTAPDTPGTLTFKVIQYCEIGLIRWIDTAEDAEYPPPTVVVGEPDA